MSCPMTTCPMSADMCHTPQTASTAETSGRATGLIRKAWRAYWDWRARKLTVMLLSSLDARTLRDIGVSPSEIEALVHCSDDRRRRYDATWLWSSGGR